MEQKPLSRLKKKELKTLLISQGYAEEELNKLKRPQLFELYIADNKGLNAEHALEAVENIEENPIQANPSDNNNLTPNDPGWTQHVLGKFLDDELDGENPRVEGLRRVAQDLIGSILEEGCDLVAAPTVENGMRACVKAWVIFGNNQRFEALADACPGNIAGEEYAVYLTAMADTRAKGRCFRNALGLKRVVAAEEVSGKVGLGVDSDSESAIHTGQITGITMVADRLNISLSKLLTTMDIECEKSDNGYINIKSLKHEQAVAIFQRLHQLQIEDNIPE